MTVEIRSPTNAPLPEVLEAEIRVVATRAGIEIELKRSDNTMELNIRGTEIESKYLTRCLLRAGYDLAI